MRIRARLAFALLPLAGLIELVLSVAERVPDASPADYDALAPVLEGTYREGDLVIVTPRWAEPHARRALGDRYFPLTALAHSDPRTFERALEISLGGERSSIVGPFVEEARREAGPFEVRVLRNPAHERVVFDFVGALRPPFATAESTEPPGRCTWTERARVMTGGLGGHPGFPRARFECPESPYLNVSVTVIADQDFLPRRCIYAHPTRTGERVVRFHGVPLGGRIVGHTGMYWIMEREKKGAPVDLEVRVDGETVGAEHHRDGDGWKRFEIALGPHGGKSSATVEFRVQSPDHRDRHFCFQADSR